MLKTWCHVVAVFLVLSLCAGCGGGEPGPNGAQTQGTLNPFGDWVWTLTNPFGCPTSLENDFPFLDMDNKQFKVFDAGSGAIGANFVDSQGNGVEMTGTFNQSTGLVVATFCITEADPRDLNGKEFFVCNGKGYVTEINTSTQVFAYNMETGQRIGPVNGTFDGAGDMGASPDGQYLAVPCSNDNTVKIVNTTTDTVVQTITATTGNPPGDPAVNAPSSCVFHPALNKLYVHNRSAGNKIGECNYISVFDTSSMPFTFIENNSLITGCGGTPPTGLCISPQPVGNDYLLVALDGGSSQNLYVINATTDQIVEFASGLPGNCQCEFTPDASLLAVVGLNGLSIYDTANFFSDTQSFDSYNIPGWDVAISTDGGRAYITSGDKGVILAGATPVPNVRCFDMTSRTEITPGPDVTGSAWGIDICPNYAMFADSSAARAFHIPNHNIMTLGSEQQPRYVRLVPNASTFNPRVIKIEFSATLTFLDQARQLDGQSQIVETQNIPVACQTTVSTDTWVFIQDPVGCE